jgi:membrane protein DedA with SNARE-associated domain
MPSLESALAWLTSLPQGGLLAVMGALAVVENIFPPIPADVMVAFGAFLAARAGASPWPPFLVIWLGNMAGVFIMFLLGRRYGTARIEQRYRLDKTGTADLRLLHWHRRYGTMAFFLARFVPGLRAVVAPVAGALGVPVTGPMVAMALASAIWYGAVTVLAFRAGSSWDTLQSTVARWGGWSAAIALGGGALLSIVWWIRRRTRGATPPSQ